MRPSCQWGLRLSKIERSVMQDGKPFEPITRTVRVIVRPPGDGEFGPVPVEETDRWGKTETTQRSNRRWAEEWFWSAGRSAGRAFPGSGVS